MRHDIAMAAAVMALSASQGRCDTTLTERFVTACVCPTYEGNLGACKSFEQGENGRCAYCDHLAACHPAVLHTDAPPQQGPTGPAPNVPASAPKAGFKMRVVKALPPIYEEIAVVFPAVKRTKGVVFAWGDVLYNPQGAEIPSALMAHEQSHGVRQLEIGVTAWWARYLDDPEFRLAEEIIGHRAEYLALIVTARHRNERRLMLKHVATRLSGPLYGRAMTYAKAVEAIRAHA